MPREDCFDSEGSPPLTGKQSLLASVGHSVAGIRESGLGYQEVQGVSPSVRCRNKISMI